MSYQTLYLNNYGSRCIVVNNLTRKKVKVRVNIKEYNIVIERTALFFEAFGNFSSVCISYKGKKIFALNYEILWEDK